MKKNKTIIKLIALAFAAMSVATSCNNFEEINQDPTKSTNMDPNLLLPTIQLYLSNNYQEWHRHLIYPGGFVQQWCGDWSTVEYGCTGKKNDPFFADFWTYRYTKVAKSLIDIIERTKDDPSAVNINSVGRIMRVLIYSHLTDIYGDIPYFDAGAGYYTGVLKPQYDKQEDIYNDFFEQLQIAHDQLDPNADNLLYDHFYNNDIAKWKKFANSLRLRLAMRLIKVNPSKAQQEAEKAVSNGVMQDNNDICLIKHENMTGTSDGIERGNGLANRLSAEGRYFRYSQRLVEYMENTNDPRLTIYGRCYLEDQDRTDITDLVYKQLGAYAKMARPTGAFNWENGTASTISITLNGENVDVPPYLQFLQPSKWFMNPASSYIHMGYAEVKLLMAEAKFRGWSVTGTTESNYEEALRASVEQMTIYGAPAVAPLLIDRFVADNALVSGSELNQINMQLWVGHILNPHEAFANWRRTNVPDLTHLVYYNANPSTSLTPRRMLYPVEEQVKNGENYDAAIARVSGYDWTVGVWWDK